MYMQLDDISLHNRNYVEPRGKSPLKMPPGFRLWKEGRNKAIVFAQLLILGVIPKKGRDFYYKFPISMMRGEHAYEST